MCYIQLLNSLLVVVFNVLVYSHCENYCVPLLNRSKMTVAARAALGHCAQNLFVFIFFCQFCQGSQGSSPNLLWCQFELCRDLCVPTQWYLVSDMFLCDYLVSETLFVWLFRVWDISVPIHETTWSLIHFYPFPRDCLGSYKFLCLSKRLPGVWYIFMLIQETTWVLISFFAYPRDYLGSYKFLCLSKRLPGVW